ncbi:unnamed protein product [Vitrella brassicaformis CCMP3155]|uniref:Uncharacterized protein n=1 Tax=Vitrella brassicaformis (strain CCMP3155) TaxID=1169540 RepID=A0A0G4H6L8_VITBC|nr:unnamed protein product [Vitrella brassicaformis CCMP3155]|eukprot:CEM39373.1 unnamed protein product [Vitrella brassicaformis CCMP3155]
MMVSHFSVDLGLLPFQEAAFVRPAAAAALPLAALEGNAAARLGSVVDYRPAREAAGVMTPELLPVPPSLVPSPCQSPPLHPRAPSTPSLHSQTGTPVTPLGQVPRPLGELSPLTLPPARRALSTASSVSSSGYMASSEAGEEEEESEGGLSLSSPPPAPVIQSPHPPAAPGPRLPRVATLVTAAMQRRRDEALQRREELERREPLRRFRF